MPPINDVTDETLLLRMRSYEDVYVERKTVGDHKDWLKTAVAFANTAPEGYPCILFIGVKNNGEIEDKGHDLDSLQKTFSQKLSVAYPPIAYLPRIVHSTDGKQALALVI